MIAGIAVGHAIFIVPHNVSVTSAVTRRQRACHVRLESYASDAKPFIMIASMSTVTNGRVRRRHRRPRRRRRARGACTTRASSTKWRAGATATSRSTPPATCRSIRPRTRRAPSTSRSWSIGCSSAASACRSSIRFTDILKHRLGEIHAAFQAAIAQNQYQGGYSCVYPIKVNQQRQVVEEVLDFGKPYNFGLEAGSKPELLAVVALADNDTPIICNGFKDAEFIETAMLAQKIGRNIIPVVEKYTELGLILEAAEKIGVRPQIGMRVKLAARGSGRWQSSGGFRSKFGLTVTEIMRGLEELKARGMQDCLKLLHFHLGSQITNIRIVKGALNEAARVYTELAKLGAGPAVPRRRRRPGRRLRRLADELRVEHELHAPGVRQRRRLPHPDGVRRGRRAASDDHLRERPRRRRLSQRAGLQRPRRLGLRRREGADHGQPGLGAAARSTWSRPTTTSPRATRSRRSTTRSRRSTWR